MRYRVGCGMPRIAVFSQIVLKRGAVLSYSETWLIKHLLDPSPNCGETNSWRLRGDKGWDGLRGLSSASLRQYPDWRIRLWGGWGIDRPPPKKINLDR